MIRSTSFGRCLSLAALLATRVMAQDTSAAPVKRTSATGEIRLTYLGNAGWEITDGYVVTHGHSDHALDAGYISRRTGATIIRHETAANLARAHDVPEHNRITVIGGEDYEFGALSLKVIPNIQSALDQKHYNSIRCGTSRQPDEP